MNEIVFLSAADSELSSVATASATDALVRLRCANLAALNDGAAVSRLVNASTDVRLVVVRIIGGAGYWRHGLEALAELAARRSGPALVVLPGEPQWDAALAAWSTLPQSECRRLWHYLVEGGGENARRAVAFCGWLIGQGAEPPPPLVLPRAGFYAPGRGVIAIEHVPAMLNPERPVAAVVFYRALLDGGMVDPIDTLVAALAEQGLSALPMFVASLKDPTSAAFIADAFARFPPAIVLNATAFAVSRIDAPHLGTVLDDPQKPVLQVVLAGSSEEAWRASPRGLAAADLTMNVAMPEVDGRILTRAISFKAPSPTGAATYHAVPERADFVARQAQAWVALGGTPPGERRVGIVLGNYPDRDGRIGNGVGLDTPQSTIAIVSAMGAAGYSAQGFPVTGEELMAVCAEREGVACSLADYASFVATLPASARAAVVERWGEADRDPHVRAGAFRLRVWRFGNLAIAVQPVRGFGIDPSLTLHDPDLVPPHHYLAFYAWLRMQFRAHAVVHVGKHGNLEWLPGKALALSQTCWPEIALGATPLIYPFIVNDPGEGTQAKRRASAVIVDHLMPAMTRAELHGGLAELETLVDEYALAAPVDQPRAALLAEAIIDMARRRGLDRDLGFAGLNPADAIRQLDGHLCDLKELQIRDGLHVLGSGPDGGARVDTLVAIARTPRSGGRPADASLQRAITADLGLAFDPLDCDLGAAWSDCRPQTLMALATDPWRTAGDAVERIERLASAIVAHEAAPPGPQSRAVLDWIDSQLAPALDGSGAAEIAAVLTALDGRFVRPGPSGAATRGRPEVMPTGRNFHSVDVRAVPTAAAWTLGRRAADALVRRYHADEGRWPRSIAMSAWATSNMRTGGDDIAQVLALIGAEPAWESSTGRVTGFRVIPLADLGRPRVDVTLKISGMFRDAFPGAIELIDEATRAVASLAESDADNPLAAATRAHDAMALRIFGAKPGAYGAGLQAPIDHGTWETREDLAAAFVAWGGFAYGGVAGEGMAAKEALMERLGQSDAVFQAQDNREHDVLDSDDYYQFMGGLAAAVETTKGVAPRIYLGDHARPERPLVRSLGEEIARVVRGRAANPKWIAGVMRHGYKGAFEIAATVDYLFAFAATTDAVADHHFEALYDAYIADASVAAFMAEANPAALRETAAKFREAIDRGLWSPRSNSAYGRLVEMVNERREAAE